MSSDNKPLRARPQEVNQRDAGLSLITRANRWMISSAVIFAAGVSAVTAHAFHARAATALRGVPSRAASAARRRSGDEDGDNALESPAQAPAAATTPPPSPAPAPPAVSGGS